MRSDMKDVIINTVRGYDIWGAYPSRKLREEYPLDLDDDDSNVVVYVKQKPTKTKAFSDRLSPLIRFLEKNVGRNWDDVWSEICKVNDYRCVRGRHLRDHAWWRRKYTVFGFHVDDDGRLARGYHPIL